ncbi:MAG TPA: 2-dehydropantoate 2-reductase [Blastocatellia bacterium]|nr:2-dehydropantoate 2-reductase [Blastocatellia bacterium]
MEREKSTRYVIFGAGAVGSAVGGLLARTGAPVAVVAREAQARALARGVKVILEGEEIETRAEAVTDVSQLSPGPRDVVFITTKSQATEPAVNELSTVYAGGTPVVSLQNGTRNEEIIARKFENVYAGLLMLSAVQLEAEIITMPRGRDIAIGLYPAGVDDLSRQMSADLRRAGFDAIASRYVMAMKWGKLIANLNNATNAITGYWLEKSMADPEMRRLMLEVREEGLRVLDACGIEAEPPAGEPSPIRIREMTAKLREPVDGKRAAEELPPERRTYASMWQDLELGRQSNEARFLNGEIVELGKREGLRTPYNSTLVEIIDRMVAARLKPGIYSPAELARLIAERARAA